MPADDLAMYVARTSAAMLLTYIIWNISEPFVFNIFAPRLQWVNPNIDNSPGNPLSNWIHEPWRRLSEADGHLCTGVATQSGPEIACMGPIDYRPLYGITGQLPWLSQAFSGSRGQCHSRDMVLPQAFQPMAAQLSKWKLCCHWLKCLGQHHISSALWTWTWTRMRTRKWTENIKSPQTGVTW